MASKVVATSPASVLPLTTTIGVGQVSMIRRVASSPSILGMWMSIVITSGCLRAMASSASSPSCAVPITRMSGSAPRICTRNSRTTGESSTTRTLIKSLAS